MGRTTTDHKKNIVSCRVSDREMAALRRRAMKSGLSITMLLRQSLDLSQPDAASQA